MKIRTFQEAKQYLYSFIVKDPKKRFPGELGLRRAKYLLSLLGNPQNKLRVVHVAGTSGKGSTSYLTSIILRSLGFKIGLSISPHLVDIRERCQINNGLPSKSKFCRHLNYIIPSIEKMKKSRIGTPSYFEILVALSNFIFWKEKVDFAVVEVGLGGLYDGTNVVTSENKLVVITRIGLDHTQVLGNTLGKITVQKAGIIMRRNTVISIWQNHKVRSVIEGIVKKQKAELFYIREKLNFDNKKTDLKKTNFDFYFLKKRLKNIELGLLGLFQVENCSLALAVVIILCKKYGFKLDFHKIRKILGKAHFPGRMQIKTVHGTTIILDGAHNPQKTSALIKSLKSLFPRKKITFLFACLKTKDYRKMLKYIIKLAQRIVITSFHLDTFDMMHVSERVDKISAILKRRKFLNYQTVKDPKEALNYILKRNDESSIIVVTGSLYLISTIYSKLELRKKVKSIN